MIPLRNVRNLPLASPAAILDLEVQRIEETIPRKVSSVFRESVSEIFNALNRYEVSRKTSQLIIDADCDLDEIWAQLKESENVCTQNSKTERHIDPDENLKEQDEQSAYPEVKNIELSKDKNKQINKESIEMEKLLQKFSKTKNKGSDKDEQRDSVILRDNQKSKYASENDFHSDDSEESSGTSKSLSGGSAHDSDDLEEARHAFYGTDDDADGEVGDLDVLGDIADVAKDVDKVLTKYQEIQRSLENDVKEGEKTLLEQRPWRLQGEVTVAQRPKDALLHEHLEIDYALKEAPRITTEMVFNLEERIKNRVKNQNFDDVQRREIFSKASDLQPTNSREEAIGERSKFSLVDLYEKEYMEKLQATMQQNSTETAHELSQQEKDELKAIELWKDVSGHLDALSNFYFTPKPVLDEAHDARIRAVKGTGAVSIEGRSTLPSEALPQDLYQPKPSRHLGISLNEMSSSEKKQLRKSNKSGAKRRNLVK